MYTQEFKHNFKIIEKLIHYQIIFNKFRDNKSLFDDVKRILENVTTSMAEFE